MMGTFPISILFLHVAMYHPGPSTRTKKWRGMFQWQKRTQLGWVRHGRNFF